MYPKKSPPIENVCIYPAKSTTAVIPSAVKPAAAASKQKPEPTFEQKIADEVERRLNDRSGNFLLGFIIGELFRQCGTITIGTKWRMKTSKKFAKHARLRFDQAEAICAKADQFKVCVHCLSISYERASTCPLCQGYRWYESADAVKLVARITQRSALPFTAGVAPRLIPAAGGFC